MGICPFGCLQFFHANKFLSLSLSLAGLLILHSSHLILYQLQLRCMGTRNYRFVHRSKRTNVPAYIQSTNTSKSSDSNVARRFSSATKIASTS